MATFVFRKALDGSTRWTAVIRRVGHPIRKRTFRRKTDAVHGAIKTESEIRDGERIAPATADRRTLANLIVHCLEGPVAQLERQAEQRGDGWLRAEKKAAARRRHPAWWRGQLGHVRLRALAPGDIAAARDTLAGRFAPATVNRYLSTLGVALKVAVNEWAWLPDSPLRRVARKKEPPGCGRPLTQDELGRLFEACRHSKEWRLYPAVVFAVSTGMRHAAVMNLTWSQVDLGAGTILLRLTKNDQVRRVPLQAQALEIMRELARTRRRVGVDYVFARRDGRKPKAIHVSWGHSRAEAGLLADGRPLRPDDRPARGCAGRRDPQQAPRVARLTSLRPRPAPPAAKPSELDVEVGAQRPLEDLRPAALPDGTSRGSSMSWCCSSGPSYRNGRSPTPGPR